MAALQAPGATVIEKMYTEKSEKYLNSKNFDVTTIVVHSYSCLFVQTWIFFSLSNIGQR